MPSQSWLAVLILLFFAGGLLNRPWLVFFSSAVMIILLAAGLWRRHALDHIHYRRRWQYKRGFTGEKTDVSLEIENGKLLPVTWLRVLDMWPNAVAPEGENALSASHIPNQGYLINSFSLRWYEKITRHYTVKFHERGLFPVGPVQFESGDIFGLYTKNSEDEAQEFITVFPDILPLSELKVETEDPFGDKRIRRRLFEDPSQCMGVRAYHPEDEFRRIHWPATARTGQLQVKVFQPVSSQVMTICLNVNTQTHFWEGYSAPMLEQLVKVCATLVHQNLQSGYSVGLLSNGCLSHADQPFKILPGRSSQQLALLLSALAGVTPYTTSPFENYLMRSIPQVPYGATIVIVTALVTPALCEVLMKLKIHRTHTTLFSLAETPPPSLPGIQSIHLPFIP
jgi:uncharacterized protein (DUF58 family)